jgi:hypothetical protein
MPHRFAEIFFLQSNYSFVPVDRSSNEKPETVDKVVVIAYFSDNCSYGFYVGGSLDGTNWTTLADDRNNDKRATANGYVCEFAPQEMRYLRVTQTANFASTGTAFDRSTGVLKVKTRYTHYT